jgi:site-specific recombinase XerD
MAFLAGHQIRFDRMPPNILSVYSEALVHQRMKPSSVIVYVAAARRFIEWSNNRGETNIAIHTSTELPKVVKIPPNSLQPGHIVEFLRHAGALPEPLRTVMLLFPYSGLRTHEAVSLKLESITQVVTQKGNAKYLCFTVIGKGGDTRTVPILLDGAGILISYLKNWRRFIRTPNRALFVNAKGKTVSDRTLRYHITRIRNRIGIKRLTLHTLRRTYLTTLQRAGVDVATITKLAGHKSFQTTLNHYLEIQPEDLASSLDKAGARLVERGVYADNVELGSKNVLDYLKKR